MKKLILLLLLSSILFACEKTLTEPEPKPEPEPEEKEQPNYVSYISGNTSTQISSLSKYTVVQLKIKYHINENEISSKGFQISQIVCTNLNAQFKIISHKSELTLRTDTIEYFTNLREFASPGDTAFFIVKLQRRLSEDTYYPLDADTIMYKVTE